MGLFSRWMEQADVAATLRAIREAKGYRGMAGLIIILDMIGTGLTLLSPVPLKIAVDSVLGSSPLPGPLETWLPPQWKTPGPLLWIVTLLLLAVVFLMQFQSLVVTQVRTQAAERITRRFRTKLFAHVQALPLAVLNRVGSSDPIYRLQYDALAVQWIVIGSLVPYVSALMSLVFMLVVIVRIDGDLALATVAVMPFMVFLSRRHRRRMPPLYDALKGSESLALGIFHQTLPFMRLVKAYGQAFKEATKFASLSSEAIALRLKVVFLENRFGLLVNVLTAGATAAVLFVGFSHVERGELTVGDLLLVITYLAVIYSPLNSVIHLFANMQEQLSGARRCFELLDRPVESARWEARVPSSRIKGHLRFDDVWFRYDIPLILRGFTLEVEPGTRLGITGPTGAGKSTLLDLLLRFYESETGRVLVDGEDVSRMPVQALRSQFAIALQDPVLFEGSVAENIAYGNPGVDRRAIIEAAEVANAHGFVSRLPHGYDTLVGERGFRLSGGERQRIALARAIVRDAPVLMLDEPTSSVDQETESLIIECLHRITLGRTSLVISHRPSVLTFCDRLIFLDNGRCREIT